METLTINGDTDMTTIKVTFLESNDAIIVDRKCKWCNTFECICDDEYERHKDQQDQYEYEQMHSDRIYDHE